MAKSLTKIIAGSRRIVFFGGAGVSTESGIADFRSGSGLHSQATARNYRPEEILSRGFFESNTDEFYAYYRTHLLHPEARPNEAHKALAALERAGRLSSVITQNIDGLHQVAGSTKVLELHGSVHRNHCVDCGRQYELAAILAREGVPSCDCGGVIRPAIVLYGESLDERMLKGAIEEISRADTLIVGGTSLVVQPAAGLVGMFMGAQLVVINRDPTPYDKVAHLIIRDPIGQALSKAAYEALG